MKSFHWLGDNSKIAEIPAHKVPLSMPKSLFAGELSYFTGPQKAIQWLVLTQNLYMCQGNTVQQHITKNISEDGYLFMNSEICKISFVQK